MSEFEKLLKNDVEENGKLYLEVDYELKDSAKALGAKWCKDLRKWYIKRDTCQEKVAKLMELKVTVKKYIKADPNDDFRTGDPEFKVMFKQYKKEDVLAMFPKAIVRTETKKVNFKSYFDT
jgi:hypothetical protein